MNGTPTVEKCLEHFFWTAYLPRKQLDSPGTIGTIIKAAFAQKNGEYHRTEGPIVTRYLGPKIKTLLNDIKRKHHF